MNTLLQVSNGKGYDFSVSRGLNFFLALKTHEMDLTDTRAVSKKDLESISKKISEEARVNTSLDDREKLTLNNAAAYLKKNSKKIKIVKDIYEVRKFVGSNYEESRLNILLHNLINNTLENQREK